MTQFDTVAIVGVGLIGGSIGLAVRERKLARSVIGIGRRESSLKAAENVGAVDRTTIELADGVAQAEVIVVCTPVDTVAKVVLEAATSCPAGALITDAGSTKQSIVSAVETAWKMPRDKGPHFVGSHPVAGDHRTGPSHARADLFVGRLVVVTPTAGSSAGAVERVTEFWQALGAVVSTMTPAEHDAALAATSHLPHLVAAALAVATPERLLPLAASGWRDTTRIAGSDPALWRPIFSTNRGPVLAALEEFEQTIGKLREALQHEDDRQLQDLLEQAQRMKSVHDALGD
jgi:prephenate dehydrogenase